MKCPTCGNEESLVYDAVYCLWICWKCIQHDDDRKFIWTDEEMKIINTSIETLKRTGNQ